MGANLSRPTGMTSHGPLGAGLVSSPQGRACTTMQCSASTSCRKAGGLGQGSMQQMLLPPSMGRLHVLGLMPSTLHMLFP